MQPHIFGVLQGKFVKWRWSEDELETQWSLSVAELALLPGRTDSGRLGMQHLVVSNEGAKLRGGFCSYVHRPPKTIAKPPL